MFTNIKEGTKSIRQKRDKKEFEKKLKKILEMKHVVFTN